MEADAFPLCILYTFTLPSKVLSIGFWPKTFNMSAGVADGLLDLPADAKDDGQDVHPEHEEDDLSNVVRKLAGKKPPPPFLRSGSWLVEYKPNDNSTTIFDGILRVDYDTGITYASGDLFQCRKPIVFVDASPDVQRFPPFIPKPQDGIPVLPLSQYSYFLQAAQLKGGSNEGGPVEMGFNLQKYNRPTGDQGGDGT